MRFHNPGRKNLRSYKVDKCLVPKDDGRVACDFLVIDHISRGYFVELKGGDIRHALRQLESSILSLKHHLGRKERILCFIVCSGNRLPVAELISRKEHFRKRLNADIIIRTTVGEHVIK